MESPRRDPITTDHLASAFEALRAKPPRVHCITSPVAAERTANTLLALGVRPSLTVNPAEVADFTRAADALLINLGMADPARDSAIPLAVAAAQSSRKPWVLDPVFVNVSPVRREAAAALLAEQPTVLKSNHSERFLADQAGPATLVAITGATDELRWQGRRQTLNNGHARAGDVTAMGCALGAVIAAFLAVEPDPLVATATALAAYGIAVEQAAACTTGPGSFGIAVYDTLAALTGETLLRKAKII